MILKQIWEVFYALPGMTVKHRTKMGEQIQSCLCCYEISLISPLYMGIYFIKHLVTILASNIRHSSCPKALSMVFNHSPSISLYRLSHWWVPTLLTSSNQVIYLVYISVFSGGAYMRPLCIKLHQLRPRLPNLVTLASFPEELCQKASCIPHLPV